MTHDILQSDIELATRLIGDRRPEGEIIRALVHRGIDPVKAAQLLSDLRSGKKVTSQSSAPLEFSLRRRSRPRHHAPETEESPSAPPPEAEVHRKPSGRPAGQDQNSSKVFRWMFAVLVGLALVVVGILLFQRYRARTTSADQPRPAAVMAKSGLPAPLVLELQLDGLRIGGSLVKRDNLLPVVASLLGVPARTNQVAQTGAVIHAYDQQGVLLYSQPGGGTNSIVLDCEGTGGVNGTTSPFAGLLKMEDRVIGPGVDATTLTAIKALGLKNAGGSGSIWNGRYQGLDLVFAYLKSTQHLSLIEIDLK